MENVTKIAWIAALRRTLDRLALFPLPNINPTLISVFSVLVMFGVFLWPQHYFWLIFIVLLSIFLDWLDGLVARRYNRASKQGYQIDSVCDRASEAVLCLLFFYPWFYLFLINLGLTAISWHTNIHFILSIRLLFVVFVILRLMGWDYGFVN